MQRVTLCIGMEFQPVEYKLRDTSLPDLFKGGTSQIPGRSITSLPVNQDGIALTNPTHTTGANCTVSCVFTGHLVAALRGTAEFSLGDHALLMGEDREEIRRRHAEAADTALGEARATASTEKSLRIGRITQTGSWP